MQIYRAKNRAKRGILTALQETVAKPQDVSLPEAYRLSIAPPKRLMILSWNEVSIGEIHGIRKYILVVMVLGHGSSINEACVNSKGGHGQRSIR